MKVEHNISRLFYLIKLYRISIDDLIAMISNGLKEPITKDDIMSQEIKVNYLKRIDKVFNKGLYYYLDPKAPEESKEASIFFRKEKFNSELNLGAKKIVNQFEDFKISLSAISKLAEINIERKLPIYFSSDDPKNVATKIRNILYPEFNYDKKEFLKSLISKFAENNILVFEFVETWNKKDKANIDGFFLEPNVIVLKRLQTSFKREIFTLIHELGHYILNEEEIESLDYDYMERHNLSLVENWCNSFSFHFLIGEYEKTIDRITNINSDNDYHLDLISEISQHTHLSSLAIYTKLLLQNKLAPEVYLNIKNHFEELYTERLAREKAQKEKDKELGIKSMGSVPKPIISPLLISTIQTAFFEGVIDEYEVCKSLKIKPDNLENFIR